MGPRCETESCNEYAFAFYTSDGRKLMLCESCAVKAGLSARGTIYDDHVSIPTDRRESIEHRRQRYETTNLFPNRPKNAQIDHTNHLLRAVKGSDVRFFRNASEAESDLGFPNRAIRASIYNARELRGWRFTWEASGDEQARPKINALHRVLEASSGDCVRTFDTVADAEAALGVTKMAIYAILYSGTKGGAWSFRWVRGQPRTAKRYAVYCLRSDGKQFVVKTQSAAAKLAGIPTSRVTQAVRGHGTVDGWQFRQLRPGDAIPKPS